MSDESTPKPKLSALALARRSGDYATVALTIDDVRRVRPAWSGPEAQHFLEQHEGELAHMMLELGCRVLATLIEMHEQEARYE
ncbi:MAG TPA: hypothetical protein VIM11_05215 [Tepidisphaeraceae bacterium]